MFTVKYTENIKERIQSYQPPMNEVLLDLIIPKSRLGLKSTSAFSVKICSQNFYCILKINTGKKKKCINLEYYQKKIISAFILIVFTLTFFY